MQERQTPPPPPGREGQAEIGALVEDLRAWRIERACPLAWQGEVELNSAPKGLRCEMVVHVSEPSACGRKKGPA